MAGKLARITLQLTKVASQYVNHLPKHNIPTLQQVTQQDESKDRGCFTTPCLTPPHQTVKSTTTYSTPSEGVNGNYGLHLLRSLSQHNQSSLVRHFLSDSLLYNGCKYSMCPRVSVVTWVSDVGQRCQQQGCQIGVFMPNSVFGRKAVHWHSLEIGIFIGVFLHYCYAQACLQQDNRMREMMIQTAFNTSIFSTH